MKDFYDFYTKKFTHHKTGFCVYRLCMCFHIHGALGIEKYHKIRAAKRKTGDATQYIVPLIKNTLVSFNS